MTGPDRSGLLGQILERFTDLDLVPEEMTIETADGGVFDQFYLKTSGGQAPDPGRVRALGQALSGGN